MTIGAIVSEHIEKYFEPGFSIWRKTPSKDDFGGFVDSWSKVQDISGRLRPISGELPVKHEKLTEAQQYRFYCKSFDIQEGDRLYHGDDHYEIIWSSNLMSANAFVQVDVKKVI